MYVPSRTYNATYSYGATYIPWKTLHYSHKSLYCLFRSNRCKYFPPYDLGATAELLEMKAHNKTIAEKQNAPSSLHTHWH